MDELKSTGMGIRQDRRRGGSKRSMGAKEMGYQLVSTLCQETWQGGRVSGRYGRRYKGGWGKTRTLMHELPSGNPISWQ